MSLSDQMDFDHVICVDENGAVTDAPSILWAPNLFEDELDDKSWKLMNGYSLQDRYSGPIMHNSEQIGGIMERDILEHPGYYVALVSYYESDEDSDTDELYVEGWAIAYREL